MTVTVLLEGDALDHDTFVVEGDLYRHLFRSRRLARGASIRAVDGLGATRAALIHEVKSDRAVLRLGEPLTSWDPALQVQLYVAPLRPERNAWLVEKATELGVYRIQWTLTERTSRSMLERDLRRLNRVARAALAQCGGARLPLLQPPCSWSDALAASTACPSRIAVAFEGGTPGPIAAGPVALFVGPEGGWSTEEREDLSSKVQHSWNLGERILRTETAAIVSVSHLLTARTEQPLAH